MFIRIYSVVNRIYKTRGRLTADEIVKLRLKGVGTRKIMEMSGTTRSAVCAILRRRKIAFPGTKLFKRGERIKGKLTVDEIKNRYSEGLSASQIAKLDGTTPRSVLLCLRRHDVKIRLSQTNFKHGFAQQAKKFGLPQETYLRLIAIEKLGGKCCKCGNTDFRVLQLNHVDTKLKQPGYADYIGIVRGTALDRDVRCANCNIIYEFDRGRRKYPEELLLELQDKAKLKAEYDTLTHPSSIL